MQPNKPISALDVTVIIPAYDAADTISRALQSIANQTFLPREVIVVDDGSNDNTAGQAEAFKPKIKGCALTVLRQSNAGPGAARNHAISVAASKWIAFLDADDEWLPRKLEKTFAAIEQSKEEPAIIAHDVTVIDKKKEVIYNCAKHHSGTGDPFHAMYRRGYVSTSTALVQRTAVIEVGGFDINLPNAQDFDLWLAILSNSKNQILVFPGAYTRHHNRPGSVQTHTLRRLQCSETVARRYFFVLGIRSGSALASLIFRTIVIHFEALITFRKSRKWFSMFYCAIRLPTGLIQMLFSAIGQKQYTRIDNLGQKLT